MVTSMASIVFLFAMCVSANIVTENERVRLWRENPANTWPPTWQNNSALFKENMMKREQELQRLPGANERWENYMQYTQSQLVPRFTERGFDIIPIPDDLFAILKEKLDASLENFDSLRNERQIDAVHTPLPSKFIDIPNLSKLVMDRLLPLHEDWVGGIKLKGTSVYGIRAYQNGSALIMHYDKVHTHVISSIVHIGHEYDNDDEPWPIEIEDHDGVLHAVNLNAGEMLFYESACSLHGRRQVFKGKHYSSVFVHYQPVDTSIWNYGMEDVIASVPPHWGDNVIEPKGSRWSGQGITTDSRVTALAPPRIIKGELVENIEEYYTNLEL